MAGTLVELHSRIPGSGDSTIDNAFNNNPEPRLTRTEFSLPPVDSGKDAWLFLAACWVVEAVTFGFGMSFGVFQNYYSHTKPFAGSGNIAAIGTTTVGVLYIATPLVVSVCRLFPRYARWFTLLGLLIASMALVSSSFCTSVSQLIITQGIMFGLGGCIAYCPCTLYIDEWFIKRKGMAYGIVWSAAGFGGTVLPLMIEAMLAKLDFKMTTQACAGVLFATAAPLSFLVKPRLPVASNPYTRPFSMRFVKSRVFIFYQLANVVEATGYFLPSVYLPTYASTTLGAAGFLPSLTIILLNLATTLGLVIMGTLSDNLPVTSCMLLSAVGTATSVLLIWGLATSLPVLYVFCVAYGLFAGSWASIWPGIMREMAGQGDGDSDRRCEYADPVMVQGHLCVGRGVGNIISGPLSATLIHGMPWKGKVIGGFGSGYGGLIVYTAVTALMSGANFFAESMKLL
ncbi:Major facilitator superfamily domain, general substrate transporter [Akanthomyces lecanii RCEF 1005]|uniref:Major facilitator superfamily domain, general substrate transporter n=1 Tax=Akanthomyces lecanii RCEF 1005 TaxID=1081108 RepID=A0A167UHT8_CORDF|nr:Major facilitator superfamily domain, general substrate transporter [Akanthomyces lecanii RCEF 1005]